MEVLSASITQPTECHLFSVIVEKMHFAYANLSNHQYSISANFMPRDRYIKLEDIVDEDLTTVKAHDHEAIFRDILALLRISL